MIRVIEVTVNFKTNQKRKKRIRVLVFQNTFEVCTIPEIFFHPGNVFLISLRKNLFFSSSLLNYARV